MNVLWVYVKTCPWGNTTTREDPGTPTSSLIIFSVVIPATAAPHTSKEGTMTTKGTAWRVCQIKKVWTHKSYLETGVTEKQSQKHTVNVKRNLIHPLHISHQSVGEHLDQKIYGPGKSLESRKQREE